MPIAVDSLSLEEYLTWLSSMFLFFSKKNKFIQFNWDCQEIDTKKYFYF